MNLKDRLSTLETQAGMGDDRMEVILLTFTTGKPEPKAIITMPHGWRRERNPGESVDAFVNRAAAEAPYTSGAVTHMIEELNANTPEGI